MMTRQQALRHFRVAVSLFFFIQGLVFAAWANRIADIKRALSLTDAQLGNVLFSIPIGQVCAMGLSAWLVNRYGSRRMIMLAGFFYPCCLLPMGFSESPYALSIALFFFGMAANLFNIAANTQAIGVEHHYGKSIMASFHGLWSMGAFSSGAISMLFIAMGMPARWHFTIIFACACLLTFLVHGQLLRSDLRSLPSEKGTSAKRVPFYKVYKRVDGMIVLLGLICFCAMLCEGCMYDWSGVYFMQVVEAPQELVQLGYVVCMCTMTLGRFITDRFVMRYGPSRIIRVCGLLIATGLLLAVALPTVFWATLGFLLVGFGISSTVPICYSLAGNTRTMNSGTAVAAVTSISYLGFLIGPPMIGHVAHAISLHYTFALIACVGLLISLGASLLSARSHAKPAHA